MEKVYAYAGYIAVNISSPNTPGLRTLQYGEALDDLLSAIKNKQNELQAIHHKYVPVAVKIAPDLSVEELIQVADSWFAIILMVLLRPIPPSIVHWSSE